MFADFINPANSVGQLLLCHFVALQLLQQCTTDFSWSQRDTAPPTSVSVSWINRMNANIGSELQRYNAWPVAIARSFEEASTTGDIKFGTVPLMVKMDPLSYGQNPIFDM